MKEHPIGFSGPLIPKLQDGTKRRTRRISKQWLKVKKGHRLWVREHLTRPDGDPWCYAADRQPVMVSKEDETAMLVWAHHKEQDYCPGIHMYRWASRILLEATEDARREPLRNVTEEEAELEGVSGDDDFTACMRFAMLWDSLHKKPGERWADNPTVTVLAFTRIPNA